MATETVELPTRVIFGEEGCWEMPSWGRHPDDEEWIVYGWRVTTLEGHMLFTNQQKEKVERWLVDNGYVDEGEGYRFARKPGEKL